MTNILKLPLLQIAFETGTNEDWLDGLAFFEADGTTAVAITGVTFRMQLRAKAEDRTAYLEASTANGKLLIGGASANVLSLNVPAAQMGSLAPGDYAFDLVAVADAHSRRVAAGSVTIVKGVTR